MWFCHHNLAVVVVVVVVVVVIIVVVVFVFIIIWVKGNAPLELLDDPVVVVVVVVGIKWVEVDAPLALLDDLLGPERGGLYGVVADELQDASEKNSYLDR